MSNFKYDVAVIGLGYVGLPLAIQATSSNLKVYGYDIDENKISNYNLGKSTIEDISDKQLQASLEKGLFLSSDPKYLSESETIVSKVLFVDRIFPISVIPTRHEGHGQGLW